MAARSNIYYLRHKEIDKKLWDACIDGAYNSMLYAKSYYLDGLVKNWDAVIYKNYESIMPLPWNRKYGFAYVYPPPFVQQSGIYAAKTIDAALIQQMVQVAEQHFSFGEYHFNFSNIYPNAIAKTNYVLDLNRSYTSIAKNYKTDLIKNLKKAKRLPLQYAASNDFEKAIDLYHTYYAVRTPHVKDKDYKRLMKTCTLLQSRNELIVREVKDEQDNLLSIMLCLKDKNRLYLLLSTTTTSGRNMEANHFMIDSIIQEFAAQKLLMDFEGSDLAGIAHFYKNFGSVNQPYFFYRWNHLPWPVSLMKK